MSHEKVQEGRQTEIRKMKEHGVYEIRPLKDLRGKKIGVKWVEEIRKALGGDDFARCRLVGKEIAYNVRDDVNAGTPP